MTLIMGRLYNLASVISREEGSVITKGPFLGYSNPNTHSYYVSLPPMPCLAPFVSSTHDAKHLRYRCVLSTSEHISIFFFF